MAGAPHAKAESYTIKDARACDGVTSCQAVQTRTEEGREQSSRLVARPMYCTAPLDRKFPMCAAARSHLS